MSGGELEVPGRIGGRLCLRFVVVNAVVLRAFGLERLLVGIPRPNVFKTRLTRVMLLVFLYF